jgi:hypothetical protein
VHNEGDLAGVQQSMTLNRGAVSSLLAVGIVLGIACADARAAGSPPERNATAAASALSADEWRPSLIGAYGGALTAAAAGPGGDYYLGRGAYLERMTPAGGELVTTRRSAELPGVVRALHVLDDLVLASVGEAGLYVFTDEGGADLRLAAEVRTGTPARDFVIHGGIAYLAEPGGLRAIDVSDGRRPVDMGIVARPPDSRGQPSELWSVELSGPHLVALVGRALDRMVVVLGLANPASPTVLAALGARAAETLAAGDGFAATTSSRGLALYRVGPAGDLEPAPFDNPQRHAYGALAIANRRLLAIGNFSLHEYDLDSSPPVEAASALLQVQTTSILPTDNEILAFSAWGAELHEWDAVAIGPPIAQLTTTGPMDLAGWVDGCGLAVSWNGDWRFDPRHPGRPPVPISALPEPQPLSLGGWNRYVVATGGATRLFSCTNDGVATMLTIEPVQDALMHYYSNGAAGDDTQLFVVEVWPGTLRQPQPPEARLTVARPGRLPGEVSVASTSLPFASNTPAIVSAASSRAVVAWPDFVPGRAAGQTAVVVTADATGLPRVTAELSGPRALEAAAMTHSAAYLAFGHELRRYALSADGRVTAEEAVAAPGRVYALTSDGDRLFAVVGRDVPGERGHRGAVYQAVENAAGATELAWIADFPLESGRPTAEVHGQRMMVNAGYTGIVWLERLLPHTCFLPALRRD